MARFSTSRGPARDPSYTGKLTQRCTYAKRQDWIEERPEIKKFSTTVRISYLERGELAAYMAELRPHFRPYMKLLVGTGLRRGEAEALTLSDLRIGDGEARAAIEDSKTPTGVRTVFLPPWAAEAVREHAEREGRGRGERIFQTPRRTVNGEHYRARKRIGRPGYTIHDHRHTAAVHLARAGMPLNLLQRQLGHTNIDMTMRYSRFHPDYGDVREYFDRMGEHLGLADDGDGGGRGDEVGRAADLLGVDREILSRALDALGAAGSNNSPDNTPAREAEEAAGAEPR